MNIIEYMCLDTTPRDIKKLYLQNLDISSLHLMPDELCMLLDLYDNMDIPPRVSLYTFVKHNIPYRAGIDNFWNFDNVNYTEAKYLLEQLPTILALEPEDDHDFYIQHITNTISDVLTKHHHELPCSVLRNKLHDLLAFEVDTFPYSWKANAECYATSILLPEHTFAIFQRMNSYSVFFNDSCVFNRILREPDHPLFATVVRMAHEKPQLVSGDTLSRTVYLDVSLSNTSYFDDSIKNIQSTLSFPMSTNSTAFTALPMNSQLAIFQHMATYPNFNENFLHYVADAYQCDERSFPDVYTVLEKIQNTHKDIWLTNIPSTPNEFFHYVNFLNTEVRHLLNVDRSLEKSDTIIDNDYSSREEHLKLRQAYDNGDLHTLSMPQETTIIF